MLSLGLVHILIPLPSDSIPSIFGPFVVTPVLFPDCFPVKL